MVNMCGILDRDLWMWTMDKIIKMSLENCQTSDRFISYFKQEYKVKSHEVANMET